MSTIPHMLKSFIVTRKNGTNSVPRSNSSLSKTSSKEHDLLFDKIQNAAPITSLEKEEDLKEKAYYSLDDIINFMPLGEIPEDSLLHSGEVNKELSSFLMDENLSQPIEFQSTSIKKLVGEDPVQFGGDYSPPVAINPCLDGTGGDSANVAIISQIKDRPTASIDFKNIRRTPISTTEVPKTAKLPSCVIKLVKECATRCTRTAPSGELCLPPIDQQEECLYSEFCCCPV